MVAQINNRLVAANGRRRKRTLNQEMVSQVLREALSHGIGYTSGGTVPDAYKYRASTTACGAVANGPDYIALKIGEINARASCVTLFAPARWMERQTLYTEAWYNHRCMAQLKTHYDAINDQILSAYAYCRDVNRDGHCPWFITSDAAVIDAALIEDKGNVGIGGRAKEARDCHETRIQTSMER